MIVVKHLNNGNFTEVIANKPFNIKHIINNILFYKTITQFDVTIKKRVASERIEDRNNGCPFQARANQYEYRFIDLSEIDAHTDRQHHPDCEPTWPTTQTKHIQKHCWSRIACKCRSRKYTSKTSRLTDTSADKVAEEREEAAGTTSLPPSRVWLRQPPMRRQARVVFFPTVPAEIRGEISFSGRIHGDVCLLTARRKPLYSKCMSRESALMCGAWSEGRWRARASVWSHSFRAGPKTAAQFTHILQEITFIFFTYLSAAVVVVFKVTVKSKLTTLIFYGVLQCLLINNSFFFFIHVLSLIYEALWRRNGLLELFFQTEFSRINVKFSKQH